MPYYTKPKWILFRHTCNLEVLKYLALDLKSHSAGVSNADMIQIRNRMEAANKYHARNPVSKQFSTMNNKISTLAFWMFGYKDVVSGSQKFMFSHLGNLFVKHINDSIKSTKILLTMTYAMQYEHPFNNTDKSISIYPFRLIYQLLRDKNLDCKLYDAEYAYIIPFTQKISDTHDYRVLVEKIIDFRSKSSADQAKLLSADEHTYVNSAYEWQFTCKLLTDAKIINQSDASEAIIRLQHPSRPGSHSAPTSRTIWRRYITLNSDLAPFVDLLIANYSPFSTPVSIDSTAALRSDAIKAIYNFYPKELLRAIGEDEKDIPIYNLPDLIREYAENQNKGDCYLFEDALEKAFNMFYNVRAKKIGGAGNPDVECLHVGHEKFNIEAKSTANKLLSINAGRLHQHRDLTKADYTILITSRYAPAASKDIIGHRVVIILADTLAEFLANNLTFNNRKIDYDDFSKIIYSNLGKDISAEISKLTFNQFGVRASVA